MLRVLHITSELDGGGVERLLFDYCSRMKDSVHFDFVVCSDEQGILEEPLKELGFNIFRITQIRKSILKNYRNLRDICEKGKYDIVHVHSGYKAVIALACAIKAKIPVRIAHSHTAYTPEAETSRIIRKIITSITKHYATDLFACGLDAAIWMWGRNEWEKGNVHVMTNAIETNSFAFSQEKRDTIRGKLGITERFVVGNVARFSYQKNHEFLIKIFVEIKKLRDDACLIMVGRGELEDEVKSQVMALGLEKSVIFMGARNDVPELLNTMDVFVLPSRYEGLPVTLVETQANGLKCFISSNVTDEIALKELVTFISIEDPPNVWAKMIINTENNISRRFEYKDRIAELGYDIKYEAGKLESLYNRLVRRNI